MQEASGLLALQDQVARFLSLAAEQLRLALDILYHHLCDLADELNHKQRGWRVEEFHKLCSTIPQSAMSPTKSRNPVGRSVYLSS